VHAFGVILVGVLGASLVATGCGGGDGGGSSGAGVEAESLFVETAESATFTDGELRLGRVSPVTTTFSERPGRDSGSLSTAEFVERFGELFGDDPPNATVSSLERSKGEFVVELSEPRYRADRRELIYTVRAIGGADADLPARVGPLSVFIDAGGAIAVISGTVSIENGGPIPGATLLLDAVSSGGDETLAVAGPDGTYSFDGVQDPGSYTLTATLPGLSSVTKPLNLSSDGAGGLVPIEVDFTLRPLPDPS
jgi:hypothetical protein